MKYLFLSLMLLAGFIGPAKADVTHNIWQQVQKGEVFLIARHALAPGTGDPDNFALRDCSTQRNLNSEGRFQSQKMGDILRENGLGDVEVHTSQWCRCIDTAKEMNLGEVVELPAVNSFFRNQETRTRQNEELKAWLMERSGKKPSIIITHQVNITALTDIFPSSGEMIFGKIDDQGNVEVVSRLQTRFGS